MILKRKVSKHIATNWKFNPRPRVSADEAPVKLVEKDEVVTVSLLNSFVESYGFPFDPVALPEPPQVRTFLDN